MKKEIKELITLNDEKICRVTSLDERWYGIKNINKTTGLPFYDFYPSVSWIAEHYPKGIAYYKWLADKGWNEAEAIKIAAGNKGSKVHKATEILDNGEEVKMTDEFFNEELGRDEQLTLEEYDCLIAYKNWCEKIKPEMLMKEFIVINKEVGYAGTADRLYKIGDDLVLVDFKTSQYIWPSTELQINSYKNALQYNETIQKILKKEKKKWQDIKMAILQLGYRRNKNHYKFTEIENKFDLFLAAKQIWLNETKDRVKPFQRDYPLSIKLKNNE